MSFRSLRNITPIPSGSALGGAFASAIVVTFIAVGLGATHQPAWALLLFGLLTALVAGLTTWPAAIATAWICWAMDSGFIIGRHAQLTFTHPAQLAALVLVAVAVLGSLAGHLRQAARSARLSASSG